MKTLPHLLLTLSLISLIHCGSLKPVTLGDGDIDPVDQNDSEGTPDGIAAVQDTYLFATDFFSSGQIYHSTTEFAALLNLGLPDLGASAVIRYFKNRLFVLHDGYSTGSENNLQMIDPKTGYQTLTQFSTGAKTNPHDVVVVGNRAFITLYNPENNPAVVNADGNPIDLLVMDINNGSTIKGISFKDYLTDNGDKTARADQMVLVGGKLYVCLQDLNGATFEADTSGKIAVVDTTTLETTQVYTLQGRNPVDIAYVAAANALVVALQAPYNFSIFNFDISTAFGGVEIVPLDGSASTLLPDEELGGYIEKVAVSNNAVFAVASSMDATTFLFTSKILRMPSNSTDASDLTEFLGNSSDIREIAIDARDQLWVARRKIQEGAGTTTAPQVDVFDADTGEALTSPMIPVVPVSSIVFSH